ncbi:hypothetical protein ACFWDQ_39195 [Streptomyces sp. NPDC060053]|uniref:hypothetical protein n=1 Tax=Streptomyces sp. NPDC060053 TaxID=3347047 RepID=UPI0036C77EDA
MPATAASSHRRRGHARNSPAKSPAKSSTRGAAPAEGSGSAQAKGSEPARGSAKSSASETALRFGRLVAMGAVAVLILFAGIWGSWGSAQHVMLTKGREQGTVEVTRCGEDTCAGPYTPLSAGSTARARVEIDKSVAVRKGGIYTVVIKPGSDEVLRSGPAGVLYAWVPLGGALLLASIVVAGGLGRARVGWVLAGSGVALLTAAFLAV